MKRWFSEIKSVLESTQSIIRKPKNSGISRRINKVIISHDKKWIRYLLSCGHEVELGYTGKVDFDIGDRYGCYHCEHTRIIRNGDNYREPAPSRSSYKKSQS